MAEAVAKVRNATPGKEATARAGSRNGRKVRASSRPSVDQGYRFTGAEGQGPDLRTSLDHSRRAPL